MTRDPGSGYVHRDLSWLAFNHRVLQEAMDPQVPLFERLAFLAIFSSNLDEFFRVRVAGLRSLLQLERKSLAKLDFNPSRVLRHIHSVVTGHQRLFGETLRQGILPALEEHGIFLVSDESLDREHAAFARELFVGDVAPLVTPTILGVGAEAPFLEDRHIYLVAELWPAASDVVVESPEYGLVEIPRTLPRFVTLPEDGHRYCVIFLDDVVRLGLATLFPDHEVGLSYSVKLSRDADLHLEDEYSGNLVDKVRKSLAKRDTGMPSRFLYDMQAPFGMISFLRARFNLADEDLVPGGRYHNLHDLADFPRFDRSGLSNPPMPPLPHPDLQGSATVYEAVERGDRILHFPYQSYGYVVRFLEEAARDARVEEIWITLYRVSDDSAVVGALVEAAQRGVRVTAFVEVKARFDEASNLYWAERMESAGVRILYSMPGLKVHAKLALVVRRERGARKLQAYLGTGNFNEKTARFYADHGLLTADPRLTDDVDRLFAHLDGRLDEPVFENLLVAPFNLRERLGALLAREAERASRGEGGRAILKMNALEDREMIDRLYEASRSGVTVEIIVRGICCLVPGLPGRSDTITARSLVDRFLEHGRVYVFGDGDDAVILLASADWMKRNLNRRIEVAFPVFDPVARAQLRAILDLQRTDDTKARILDGAQRNRYARGPGPQAVRAQTDTYRWLERSLANAGWSGQDAASDSGAPAEK